MARDSDGVPIACVLTALTDAEQKRRQWLAERLFGTVQQTHELGDGFALELPDDDEIWMQMAEFVTLERRCCPFLSFALYSAEEGQPIQLHITGRSGVKAFLKQQLGLSGV
ncbi:MAG: hypothetical protein GFH27_549287n98 [Chloroflexi bacterium AL-W]|nr:hypothetical protein [Chloroflexi bacterium AL-N1]NOK66372.1 hypothetical protein [Chloroflexi bacterium AL-N10]NOK71760.1 hypothetical protein [Chloroflexi bacterium AL-N5]NOK81017.1 hypothetical protein [Chloroflexi bacterium AL-W]NOK89290.1 hypothetical protein [Chloroflexi bacterium AL-N15]